MVVKGVGRAMVCEDMAPGGRTERRGEDPDASNPKLNEEERDRIHQLKTSRR